MIDAGDSSMAAMRAWRKGDLHQVVDLAEQAENGGFQVYALHLMALTRLGRVKEAGNHCRRYRRIAKRVPWDARMFGLIVGQENLPQVLAEAPSPQAELQAMAHEAIRLLSEGRAKEAQAWRFLAKSPKTPRFEHSLLLREQVPRRGRREEATRGLLRRAKELLELGKDEESLHAARTAFDISRADDVPRVLHGEALWALARVHKHRTDFHYARPLMAEAARIFRFQYTDHDPVAFEALLEYAHELKSSGYWEEALPLYEQLDAAQDDADASSEQRRQVLRGLMTCCHDTGEHERALELYEKAVQDGPDRERGYDLSRMGHLLLHMDRPEDALQVFEEALPLRCREPFFGSTAFIDLAGAKKALGDTDAAQASIDEAMQFIHQTWQHDPKQHAVQLRVAATCLDGMDEHDQAQAVYKQALEALQDEDDAWERILAYEGLARSHWLSDQRSEAESYLRRALKASEARGDEGAYFLRRLEQQIEALRSGQAPPEDES